MKQPLVLGTRGSRLALAQAEKVRAALSGMFPGSQVILKIIKTEGDADRSSPLSSFGGRGAFVRSLEAALLRGEIDAAVHSLKDLPSSLPGGLVLGAVPFREDPRDVLVSRDGRMLDSLGKGDVVGTGSERRAFQIERIRPGVVCRNIRGNLETRLRKLDEGKFDAVVLAAAGLKRLGLGFRITQYFDTGTMLPAPCQGAIGVECRANDDEMLGILGEMDDPDVRLCTDAERIFVRTLGLGCHAPVGALAVRGGPGIVFSAFVFSGRDGAFLDGTVTASGEEIFEAVRGLAEEFKRKIDG